MLKRWMSHTVMSHTKKIHEKILFEGVKSFQKCKKNPITMQDLKQPQSIWILMERGLSHTNMSHTFFLKKSLFWAIKTGRNKRKRYFSCLDILFGMETIQYLFGFHNTFPFCSVTSVCSKIWIDPITMC